MARYGEVRHRAKKVSKAAVRARMREGGAGWFESKRGLVSVKVRVSQAVGYKGKGHFEARACISRPSLKVGKQWTHSGSRGTDRCGNLARGTTPSKAFNAALRKLAQTRK